MPKNSKNQDSNGARAADSSAAEAAPQTKKRSKPAAKTTAAKKSVAKTGAKKAPARKTPRKSKGYEPSDDEIRIRAYFIAERRTQMSLGGDQANDWLEARQQLLEEADQRKSAATPAPV